MQDIGDPLPIGREGDAVRGEVGRPRHKLALRGIVARKLSLAQATDGVDPLAEVAAGPGLGNTPAVGAVVRALLARANTPLVLDADALNALAEQTDILSKLRRPLIITPHPGEFARLIGRSTAEIQGDRETHAVALAQADHLIVVLKGARTVVTDGRRVYVNTTGNPGMATGGSGDVLTGVIAALIGQKLPPFEAAQLGVHVHGLAGDIARDQNGEIGMIAGDIVDSLPDAFEHLTQP